jgi:hypothetical protein
MANTTVTSGQQSIPEVLEPYFTGTGQTGTGVGGGLLPAAQQLFSRDYKTAYGDALSASGLEGAGRIAGLSPNEVAAGQQIANLGQPTQFGQGQAAYQTGLGSLDAAKTAYQGGPNVNAPSLTNYQMTAPGNVTAQGLTTFGMAGADKVNAPQGLSSFDVSGANNVNAPQGLQSFNIAGAGNVNAPQGLSSFDISGAGNVNAQNLNTYQMGGPQSYTGQNVTQYMNPYQQNVVDVQKAEALRDAQKQLTGANLGSARQGTYGGARNALMQSEAGRNLQTQMGNIQATGSQNAFQNAQQQFNQQNQLQQSANAQNLQAALGVQQLGSGQNLQAQLANQQANQQAQLANQQARLGVQQFGAGQSLEAQKFNQANAQQAQLANQQAQLGVQQLSSGQSMQSQLANQQAQQAAQFANQQARLGVQQFGAGQNLQSQLANQQAQQAAQQANLQSQQATQQLGSSQSLQAMLANQAAQQATGQTNLQAQLGIQQLGAGQSLEAQRANQAAQMQRAAGLGQLGQTYGALGQGLGQQGALQQQADIARSAALGAYGGTERQVAQQQLDSQYQDQMRALGFGEQQLGNMSNVLRGVPLGDAFGTQTTTQTAPSFASQLAGIGLGGLSLANMIKS